MIYVFVTVADKNQANVISQALLEAKLALCIKTIPVDSKYLWRGTIEQSNEIFMIIESRQDLYQNLYATILKHHSYELPNITYLKADKVPQQVESWIKQELK